MVDLQGLAADAQAHALDALVAQLEARGLKASAHVADIREPDAVGRLFEVIWAAAGSPFAVFRLTPAELVRVTGGRVVDLKAG